MIDNNVCLLAFDLEERVVCLKNLFGRLVTFPLEADSRQRYVFVANLDCFFHPLHRVVPPVFFAFFFELLDKLLLQLEDLVPHEWRALRIVDRVTPRVV